MTTEEQAAASNTATANGDEAPTTITGRSVFLIETTPQGVAVQTSFMTEDGKFLQMPAIFPDVEYALEQIAQLRKLVLRHFSQAAKAGGQALAAQAQQAEPAQQPADAPPAAPVEQVELTQSVQTVLKLH